MGIDGKEQVFPGDGYVLYLDCWLQGCIQMSKLIIHLKHVYFLYANITSKH